MLSVIREHILPTPPGASNSASNIRTVGVHTRPCALDNSSVCVPRLLLVRELICHLQGRRCIYSELLLYNHQSNQYITLLPSLPSATRILSVALSSDGVLLAFSTVTRDWGSHYRYAITVTNFRNPALTASFRLRSPADVCFLGDSSPAYILVLTYIPIVAKITTKHIPLKVPQLRITPMPDLFRMFGEVLHIQCSHPYILSIELPSGITRYNDTEGVKHAYTHLLRKIDTKGSAQLLILRLYEWHETYLVEVRRLPITIPARYRILPFANRGSIQVGNAQVDLIADPGPLVVLSCYSHGCTLIKICTCKNATIFTFSLPNLLSKGSNSAEANTQADGTGKGAGMQDQAAQRVPHYDYIAATLQRFILVPHQHFLLFLQPYSLTHAQLIVVAIPHYDPAHIAYSTTIPFQICNLRAYTAMTNVAELPTVSRSLSTCHAQRAYAFQYIILNLINIEKEQALADIQSMHTAYTLFNYVMEYPKWSAQAQQCISDSPFSFVSYQSLAKIYPNKHVHRLAGLPEVPEVDTGLLMAIRCAEIFANYDPYSDAMRYITTLIGLMTAAIAEKNQGSSGAGHPAPRTTGSSAVQIQGQDFSATNFSTANGYNDTIPSAMHTCATDYTEDCGAAISSVVPSYHTFENVMREGAITSYLDLSADGYVDSTIITSVADTTAFDDSDSQYTNTLQRIRRREASSSSAVKQKRFLMVRVKKPAKPQANEVSLEQETSMVTSKGVMSSKTDISVTAALEGAESSNRLEHVNVKSKQQNKDKKDTDCNALELEADCAKVSFMQSYACHPVNGSVSFPIQASIDIDFFLDNVTCPAHALHLHDLDDICYLSRSWRYTVISPTAAATYDNVASFYLFDMFLQRLLNMTIDFSKVYEKFEHPTMSRPGCLSEIRLLHLNCKLVLLYCRYMSVLAIILLNIRSEFGGAAPIAATGTMHQAGSTWWRKMIGRLRASCILEFSTLLLCLLERTANILCQSGSIDALAIYFAFGILKAILLRRTTSNGAVPSALDVNLYSNPLHIFLTSVSQSSISTIPCLSKHTTMYAVHSYLHIATGPDFPASIISNHQANVHDTADCIDSQIQTQQQSLCINDPLTVKNLLFGIGRSTQLRRYMSLDSICPTYADNDNQEALAALKLYMDRESTLTQLGQGASSTINGTAKVNKYADILSHNARAEEGNTALNTIFLTEITKIMEESNLPTQDANLPRTGNSDNPWTGSAVYQAFASIVDPLYQGLAATFFGCLYENLCSMGESCLTVEGGLTVEELNLVLSVCEALNLNFMANVSIARLFKRALSQLYSRFPSQDLQTMISTYL